MVNFLKKLLRLRRTVLMVDDLNRKQEYTTYDYPEKGLMILHLDNRSVVLPVEKFVKAKDIYHLETSKGLYILKYTW